MPALTFVAFLLGFKVLVMSFTVTYICRWQSYNRWVGDRPLSIRREIVFTIIGWSEESKMMPLFHTAHIRGESSLKEMLRTVLFSLNVCRRSQRLPAVMNPAVPWSLKSFLWCHLNPGCGSKMWRWDEGQSFQLQNSESSPICCFIGQVS